MNVKASIWNVGVQTFGALPKRVRDAFSQICAQAAGRQAPADALRELLATHDMVRERLDIEAIRYEGGIHPKHRLMNYHRFFVERLSAANRVLDVGCGYGAVAHSMAEAGAAVTGVDMSEESIAHARRRYAHPGLTFLVGEVPHVLPPGPFDTIVLSNVLEHIEHRLPFLEALREAFAPTRWLIRVPMIDRDWIIPLKQELGMFPYGDPTHFIEYTETSFAAETAEAGLRIVERCINWGEIWAELKPA